MRALIPLLIFCIALTAPRVEAADPYEGEAAVASQSEADRVAALPNALAAVFVGRTGNPASATDARLQEALPQAASWLQQYRYRSRDDGSSVLIARFDPLAVDRALSAAGLMPWPEPRPQPVVWLAIDDGRGPRLLGSAQAQAVGALTARAQQRGLTLAYPLLDIEDQQAIDANRVWALDPRSAQVAAQRYQSSAVLLGKLFREGTRWVAEWRVLQDGEVLEDARYVDADSATVLAAGADLAVGALSRRYAADLAAAGPPGRFRLRIGGISSAEDYARLLGQLKRMPAVRSLDVTGSEGDALLIEVELGTGINGFGRSTTSMGLLAVDETPTPDVDVGDDDAATLHRFRLQR